MALAAIDEHRMHDYATSVLAFAAAARLAVHRGDLKEADRQLTRAMRARPSCTFVLPCLAVRVRLQLAKVYWAIGDQTTARHLLREIDDILLHRPALGVLVDEVAEFRADRSRRARRSERPAGRPSPRRSFGCSRTCRPTSRSARSASGCSCPATPSAPRSARSIGSWASPHAATRCNRRRRSVCSAGSRDSLTGLVFQGLVDVVPERHRQLRGRRDDAGQPDDGNDADQHVDDLGGRRAGTHRGIGLRSVGRHRATDRDQRGEPDQRQRLRIELSGLEPRLRRRRPAKRASLMASRRSRSV